MKSVLLTVLLFCSVSSSVLSDEKSSFNGKERVKGGFAPSSELTALRESLRIPNYGSDGEEEAALVSDRDDALPSSEHRERIYSFFRHSDSEEEDEEDEEEEQNLKGKRYNRKRFFSGSFYEGESLSDLTATYWDRMSRADDEARLKPSGLRESLSSVFGRMSMKARLSASVTDQPAPIGSFPIARFVSRKLKERRRKRSDEKAAKELQQALSLQQSLLNDEERLQIELLPPLKDIEFPNLERIQSLLFNEYMANHEKFAADEEAIKVLLLSKAELKNELEAEKIVTWLLQASKKDNFLNWKDQNSLDEELEVFLEQATDYYSRRLHKLKLEFDLKMPLAECHKDQIAEAKFEPGANFHEAFADAFSRYEQEHKELLAMCLQAINYAETLNSIQFIQRRS